MPVLSSCLLHYESQLKGCGRRHMSMEKGNQLKPRMPLRPTVRGWSALGLSCPVSGNLNGQVPQTWMSEVCRSFPMPPDRQNCASRTALPSSIQSRRGSPWGAEEDMRGRACCVHKEGTCGGLAQKQDGGVAHQAASNAQAPPLTA